MEVAILGMGYVGLPTALGLYANGVRTIGVDISERRLAAIRDGSADLLDDDRLRLIEALGDKNFQLTSDAGSLSGADAVIVCVPTPLDRYLTPDLTALRAACASVVDNVMPGQVLILTSTSFVGAPYRADRGTGDAGHRAAAASGRRPRGGNAVRRRARHDRCAGAGCRRQL